MPNQSRRAAQSALDASLKAMFDTLAARPTPDRIRSVVDQIAGEAPPQAIKRPARR